MPRNPRKVPPPLPARPRDLLIVLGEAQPDEGTAPLAVVFTCESLETNDEPSAYHWDFGDGSEPSREPNPRHTYARPGMYVARVVAWNEKGHVGDDTVRVDVQEAE